MPTHGGHAEERPDGNAGKPRAALSLRRSPNPWAGVTVFAAVVTVLMAVGMATAFAVGQRGLAFVPAAVAAFGIWLVIYTNTRRSHPETLVITGDAIEYIGQADRGLALTRPRSEAAWADVTGIAVVTWRNRPWIGLRTRDGAHLTGRVWFYLREHDLQLMAAADSWEVPRDQLVRELRLAGERAGVAWLGELTAAKT